MRCVQSSDHLVEEQDLLTDAGRLCAAFKDSRLTGNTRHTMLWEFNRQYQEEVNVLVLVLALKKLLALCRSEEIPKPLFGFGM